MILTREIGGRHNWRRWQQRFVFFQLLLGAFIIRTLPFFRFSLTLGVCITIFSDGIFPLIRAGEIISDSMRECETEVAIFVNSRISLLDTFRFGQF